MNHKRSHSTKHTLKLTFTNSTVWKTLTNKRLLTFRGGRVPAALWRDRCLTSGFKTNGQNRVLGSNICWPVAKTNSWLTGISLENTLELKTIQTSWGRYGTLKTGTHDLWPPLAAVCLHHVPVGYTVPSWVSVCPKLPWRQVSRS